MHVLSKKDIETRILKTLKKLSSILKHKLIKNIGIESFIRGNKVSYSLSIVLINEYTVKQMTNDQEEISEVVLEYTIFQPSIVDISLFYGNGIFIKRFVYEDINKGLNPKLLDELEGIFFSDIEEGLYKALDSLDSK